MEFKADKKKALMTKIRLLRERGGTYSEIAELFNSEGVKTYSGVKWETRNLYNFYQRNKKAPN